MSQTFSAGGCTCRGVRYALSSDPMFVHCCHCRWCQRETGSAFALNALIETDRVLLQTGAPQRVPVPSESGRGQTIVRCPSCRVALWSHYPGAGEKIAFVRVGTLDSPELCPPDVHIYTASRQPWFALPARARAFADYYRTSETWPEASRARLDAIRGR